MDTRNERIRDSQRLDPEGVPREGATDISSGAMEAGPAGVVEREVTIRRTEPTPPRRTESRPDRSERVAGAAETALDRTADALERVAPTVGRGAEAAVSGAGSALTAASGVIGTVVGKIAGRVGGWWNSASETLSAMPEEERQACLVHFEAYEVRPAGITFEHALPGYTVGYIAAANPAYRGRAFEEIEPELRHGFGDDLVVEYDVLRDFSRFGYERAARAAGASGQEESGSGDMQRAREHTGEAARHAREALKAGASAAVERAKDAARDAGQKATAVAGSLGEARPDRELERRADQAAEQAVESTGGAMQGAAPTVRKGVEATVRATASALHAAAGPLGSAVGRIASKAGGWWNSARERTPTFSQEEDTLCIQHFEAYEARPAELDYETARTAYLIGYLAAENPAYQDRAFDDIAVELHPGLTSEPAAEVGALRDFARFGYERARVVRLPDDEDRVTVH